MSKKTGRNIILITLGLLLIVSLFFVSQQQAIGREVPTLIKDIDDQTIIWEDVYALNYKIQHLCWYEDDFEVVGPTTELERLCATNIPPNVVLKARGDIIDEFPLGECQEESGEAIRGVSIIERNVLIDGSQLQGLGLDFNIPCVQGNVTEIKVKQRVECVNNEDCEE